MTAARRIDHRPEGPEEAAVTAVVGSHAVELTSAAGPRRATLAVAGYRPEVGDRVLLLEGDRGAWVIGVVASLRPVGSRTSDGVEARVETGVDGDVLTVRAPGGEVLFTHCAHTGRSTVRAPGDLALRAEGDLKLEAKEAVHIRGREVSLSTDDAHALHLGPRGTEMRAPQFRAVLGEARLSVRDLTFAADRVQSAATKVRQVFGVVEVQAQRIVERTRDVFREVEGVSQTRAGRIRTVARGAYSVVAERATIKAEDEMHLMGEKIHLA